MSNKADAYGLVRAAKHGIPTAVVDHKAYESREAFDAKLVEVIRASGAVLVCLAGFMRVVTPVFLRAFPHRILNIHPALLPSFPGTHGPAQALRYGVRFSGCTVHFLDEGVDTGPIIVQAVVPVHEDDTEESLAARILKEEHRIYPMAIRLFLEGRLTVDGEKGVHEGRGKDPRLLPAQPRRLIPSPAPRVGRRVTFPQQAQRVTVSLATLLRTQHMSPLGKYVA